MKYQFHTSFDAEGIPNFEKESLFIYKNIMGIKETIDLNFFVNFVVYDKDGCVTLGNSVEIENNGKRVTISEDGEIHKIFEIDDVE